MNTTLFRQIGPYTIERRIGGGGMGQVYLATDTRSGQRVALKVPGGSDADAPDILAAEQRGAELQQRLADVSQYVPHVYEIDSASGCFYIAMEYIEGEDLSAILRAGPLAPERAAAIAIQLARFLEDVDRVAANVDGASDLTLLHNDLKPTNVRVVAGDGVKVLDFGAAKALSLSRRVTKNEFGSTHYLSPECIESGELDRRSDAWALGVLLYEMVTGRLPFRGSDRRQLEDRIRARRPPDPAADSPRSLRAIIAKLLAPAPEQRYPDAVAIRTDLEHFVAREATVAESEGWPERAADEPPTRRTRTPIEDEPPTRPTTRDGATPAIAERDELPVTAATRPAAPAKKTKRRHLLRTGLLLVLLILAGNEGCVAFQANRLATSVPMQEFDGFTNVWTEYEVLHRRSYLGSLGVRELQHALTRQALVLADGVIGNYRTPTPTVREAQWEAAASALRRALTVAPADTTVRAGLRYSEGHLHRINGEAAKARRQTAPAQREFAEALSAFREAASLRPKWPDPFLGLARTFIYGLEDIDRGADAMNQAQVLGYTIGPRETAQLADGYRVRGESLQRAAGELVGMPQERDTLSKSADALKRALELYSQIADLPDVPAKIRATQGRLDRVEHQRDEIPFLRFGIGKFQFEIGQLGLRDGVSGSALSWV